MAAIDGKLNSHKYNPANATKRLRASFATSEYSCILLVNSFHTLSCSLEFQNIERNCKKKNFQRPAVIVKIILNFENRIRAVLNRYL